MSRKGFKIKNPQSRAPLSLRDRYQCSLQCLSSACNYSRVGQGWRHSQTWCNFRSKHAVITPGDCSHDSWGHPCFGGQSQGTGSQESYHQPREESVTSLSEWEMERQNFQVHFLAPATALLRCKLVFLSAAWVVIILKTLGHQEDECVSTLLPLGGRCGIAC